MWGGDVIVFVFVSHVLLQFVMLAYGLTEMEAVSIITQGIDFGMHD